MSPPDRKSIVVMVGGEQEQIRAAPGRHQVRRDERERRDGSGEGIEGRHQVRREERRERRGERRERDRRYRRENGERTERVVCSPAVVVYEMY